MTWYVRIESYSEKRADNKLYEPNSALFGFETEREAAAFLRKAVWLPYKTVSFTKWSDEDEN